MTKKEIVQYLKQNMPHFEGTKEEIELKTALYIYIELGKIKSFDEKYFLGNSQVQKKIYELARRETTQIDQIAKKKKIICLSLAYLYCSILKEFGITANISPRDQDGHVYSMIETKGNTRFMADLQLDLENIQTKSRLEHFGILENTSKNETINANQKQLTQMLIDIGYIANENDYKNKEIDKLSEQVKNKNPHEALKIILEDEKLYKENEEMGIVEVNKFYKRILRKIVPNFYGKRIFAFNCYRKKEKDEREYTLCVFSEEDNVRIYMFSKKERRFLNVDISKMRQLQEEGLVLGARPKENGTNKLKKYIDRQSIKEDEEIKHH